MFVRYLRLFTILRKVILLSKYFFLFCFKGKGNRLQHPLEDFMSLRKKIHASTVYNSSIVKMDCKFWVIIHSKTASFVNFDL